MTREEFENAKAASDTRREVAEKTFHEELKNIARANFGLLLQCDHKPFSPPTDPDHLYCNGVDCDFPHDHHRLPTEAELACPHADLEVGYWPDETSCVCASCGVIMEVYW
jgi:hypothetical protein